MSEMGNEEIEALQKAGANARAFGRNFLDNPYLKTATLPGNSGMSLEAWRGRHDAWHLGWTIEDAMRGK